jgi:hypothetical protein
MRQKDKREKHYFKDRKHRATLAKIRRKADKYSTQGRRVTRPTALSTSLAGATPTIVTVTDEADVSLRRSTEHS